MPNMSFFPYNLFLLHLQINTRTAVLITSHTTHFYKGFSGFHIIPQLVNFILISIFPSVCYMGILPTPNCFVQNLSPPTAQARCHHFPLHSCLALGPSSSGFKFLWHFFCSSVIIYAFVYAVTSLFLQIPECLMVWVTWKQRSLLTWQPAW